MYQVKKGNSMNDLLLTLKKVDKVIYFPVLFNTREKRERDRALIQPQVDIFPYDDLL